MFARCTIWSIRSGLKMPFLLRRPRWNDNCPLIYVHKERMFEFGGIMRPINSIKGFLSFGGLFAAILAFGGTAAIAQDDYEQRRSDRRSRSQQEWSDRNSRRQQAESDWNSRRQQQWSDRSSRRQQQWSDQNSRRQWRGGWNRGRRWNTYNYWRWRRQQWNDRRRRGDDDNRRRWRRSY